MQDPEHGHPNGRKRSRDGVVLVMTVVLLVVLASLAYTLTARVARQSRRNDYLVDYTKARYACDSAVRYALATLEDIEPQLISRPNEPDFSDLFVMSDEQVEQMLADWAALTGQTPEDSGDAPLALPGRADRGEAGAPHGLNDANGLGDLNDINDASLAGYGDESLEDRIRGPYGPRWPLLTETAEFDVGDVTVTIEIEDEHAKYPLGWALLDEPDTSRESLASFETFCEWMRIDAPTQDRLKEDLATIVEIKPFKLEFRPITTIDQVPNPATQPAPQAAPAAGTAARTATVSRAAQTRTLKKTVSIGEQIDRQCTDFGKLLNSALFDRDILARPTRFGRDRVESLKRAESPMKYMSVWGTRQVNINTAPRHVLEALFVFGGDGPQIAQAIIERRRIEPFKDVQDLTGDLFKFQVSIQACEKYIAYRSTIFTIHVKAVCGTAKAYSTIAISKDGKTVKRIAVVNS